MRETRPDSFFPSRQLGRKSAPLLRRSAFFRRLREALGSEKL